MAHTTVFPAKFWHLDVELGSWALSMLGRCPHNYFAPTAPSRCAPDCLSNQQLQKSRGLPSQLFPLAKLFVEMSRQMLEGLQQHGNWAIVLGFFLLQHIFLLSDYRGLFRVTISTKMRIDIRYHPVSLLRFFSNCPPRHHLLGLSEWFFGKGGIFAPVIWPNLSFPWLDEELGQGQTNKKKRWYHQPVHNSETFITILSLRGIILVS